MNKFFLISLLTFGSICVANSQINANEKSYSHKSFIISHETEAHEHKTVMISEGESIPSVNLVVHEDAVKGWNLEIKLSNFEFTPENVNVDSNINQGHAHLYINGEKVTRIYGNWYYLAELPSGTNEIKIGLNTNKHESLMYQDKMIEVTQIIEVK